MKTFSDVKKRFKVGTELKLIRHDWLKPNLPLQIGAVRKIVKVQSNAIQFEGGSWLNYPKASDVVTDGENQFSIVLNIEKAQFMSYEFV
jgi:hypothetical protein